MRTQFSERGTTLLDGDEVAPNPARFLAATVNVYDTWAVRPVTLHTNGPVVHVHVRPPGEEVTRYSVMGYDVLAGAVQVISAWLGRDEMARTLVGAAGGEGSA